MTATFEDLAIDHANDSADLAEAEYSQNHNAFRSALNRLQTGMQRQSELLQALAPKDNSVGELADRLGDQHLRGEQNLIVGLLGCGCEDGLAELDGQCRNARQAQDGLHTLRTNRDNTVAFLTTFPGLAQSGGKLAKDLDQHMAGLVKLILVLKAAGPRSSKYKAAAKRFVDGTKKHGRFMDDALLPADSDADC